MPGRVGSPTPARSGNRASSPLTSVPVGLPAPGWTTRPGRLVDDDDRVVDVDDVELDAGSGRAARPRDRRRVDLDERALVQADLARRGDRCRRRARPPASITAAAADG